MIVTLITMWVDVIEYSQSRHFPDILVKKLLDAEHCKFAEICYYINR